MIELPYYVIFHNLKFSIKLTKKHGPHVIQKYEKSICFYLKNDEDAIQEKLVIEIKRLKCTEIYPYALMLDCKCFNLIKLGMQ